jgi:regulator of cell morphogenesis and NO signaling
MKIDTTKPVGEIAAEMPGAIPVFEEMRVDYAFAGNRTLREACALAGVPVDKVVGLLEEAAPSGAQGDKDRRRVPIGELIDTIVEQHHLFAWSRLAYLRNLATKVAYTEGAKRPELAELNKAVHAMANEMEEHMAKEEEIVFPFLREAVQAREKGEPLAKDPDGGTAVERPLQILLWEHGTISGRWNEIRGLTHDYRPLPGDPPAVKELYRHLREYELNLHHHTHLENNVLFKRVMDSGLLG